jgi:sugar/nucleoside kinase (ribokinase family)
MRTDTRHGITGPTEKRDKNPTNGPQRIYDLCGMGNPLVDVLFKVDDGFLASNGLNRGVMHLIDKKRKDELLRLLEGREKVVEIGGSCPNTILTLARLGARVALTGKIGNDEYGDYFEKSVTERGIVSFLRRSTYDTGICTILITPDKERTMNTYLGACREYSVDDLPVDMIANSRYFYVTGYMWDTKKQKEAISYALEIAKENRVKIVFDIADPFAVERHRDDFLQIIEHSADIVFANAQEAHLLNEARLLDDRNIETAIAELGRSCELAVVKNGAKDTHLCSSGTILKVPSFKTRAIDTTGAGDNFAAGFLYGLIQGLPVEQCGIIASFVASKTIEKIGAQAPMNIRELVQPLIQVSGRSGPQ